MTQLPGAAVRESSRRNWRAAARAWGPPGNERLTASTGLILIVLLAVETLTTLALRTYLPVHIFLGLLLLPPVALKLASTGWRFLRYYTRNKPYRLEGAPRPLQRMLAPLLVASTLSLFGSGVALIAVGHGGGVLRTVHSLSFLAWGVLLIVHVLAYLKRVFRIGTSDWRRNAGLVVAGAKARRAALGAALLTGVSRGSHVPCPAGLAEPPRPTPRRSRARSVCRDSRNRTLSELGATRLGRGRNTSVPRSHRPCGSRRAHHRCTVRSRCHRRSAGTRHRSAPAWRRCV